MPNPGNYGWLQVVEPCSIPSEWLTTDLGAGELAAMALALENSAKVILLDDGLARRVAQAAGLKVWETLKVLPEAKSQGLTEIIKPLVKRLKAVGMYISDDIRRRVLALASE